MARPGVGWIFVAAVIFSVVKEESSAGVPDLQDNEQSTLTQIEAESLDGHVELSTLDLLPTATPEQESTTTRRPMKFLKWPSRKVISKKHGGGDSNLKTESHIKTVEPSSHSKSQESLMKEEEKVVLTDEFESDSGQPVKDLESDTAATGSLDVAVDASGTVDEVSTTELQTQTTEMPTTKQPRSHSRGSVRYVPPKLYMPTARRSFTTTQRTEYSRAKEGSNQKWSTATPKFRKFLMRRKLKSAGLNLEKSENFDFITSEVSQREPGQLSKSGDELSKITKAFLDSEQSDPEKLFNGTETDTDESLFESSDPEDSDLFNIEQSDKEKFPMTDKPFVKVTVSLPASFNVQDVEEIANRNEKEETVTTTDINEDTHEPKLSTYTTNSAASEEKVLSRLHQVIDIKPRPHSRTHFIKNVVAKNSTEYSDEATIIFENSTTKSQHRTSHVLPSRFNSKLNNFTKKYQLGINMQENITNEKSVITEHNKELHTPQLVYNNQEDSTTAKSLTENSTKRNTAAIQHNRIIHMHPIIVHGNFTPTNDTKETVNSSSIEVNNPEINNKIIHLPKNTALHPRNFSSRLIAENKREENSTEQNELIQMRRPHFGKISHLNTNLLTGKTVNNNTTGNGTMTEHNKTNNIHRLPYVKFKNYTTTYPSENSSENFTDTNTTETVHKIIHLSKHLNLKTKNVSTVHKQTTDINNNTGHDETLNESNTSHSITANATDMGRKNIHMLKHSTLKLSSTGFKENSHNEISMDVKPGPTEYNFVHRLPVARLKNFTTSQGVKSFNESSTELNRTAIDRSIIHMPKHINTKHKEVNIIGESYNKNSADSNSPTVKHSIIQMSGPSNFTTTYSSPQIKESSVKGNFTIQHAIIHMPKHLNLKNKISATTHDTMNVVTGNSSEENLATERNERNEVQSLPDIFNVQDVEETGDLKESGTKPNANRNEKEETVFLTTTGIYEDIHEPKPSTETTSSAALEQNKLSRLHHFINMKPRAHHITDFTKNVVHKNLTEYSGRNTIIVENSTNTSQHRIPHIETEKINDMIPNRFDLKLNNFTKKRHPEINMLENSVVNEHKKELHTPQLVYNNQEDSSPAESFTENSTIRNIAAIVHMHPKMEHGNSTNYTKNTVNSSSIELKNPEINDEIIHLPKHTVVDPQNFTSKLIAEDKRQENSTKRNELFSTHRPPSVEITHLNTNITTSMPLLQESVSNNGAIPRRKYLLKKATGNSQNENTREDQVETVTERIVTSAIIKIEKNDNENNYLSSKLSGMTYTTKQDVTDSKNRDITVTSTESSTENENELIETTENTGEELVTVDPAHWYGVEIVETTTEQSDKDIDYDEILDSDIVEDNITVLYSMEGQSESTTSEPISSNEQIDQFSEEKLEEFVTVDPAHWYGVEYSSEENDALLETTTKYISDYVKEATSEQSQKDNFDKSHLEVEYETEKINKLISVTATKNSSNDQSSDEVLKNSAGGTVPRYDHIKESTQDEQTADNITSAVTVIDLAIENATVETNNDTGSETSDAESTSISFLDEVGEEFVIVDPAHRYGVESGSQEKETLLETTTEYLSDYLEEATSEEKDNFDKSHLEVENENDLILEVPNTDRNVSINESRKAKELTDSSKTGAINKPISVTATKSSSNDQSVDEALNNSAGGTVPRYGHMKESTQDEQTTDNIANMVTVYNLAIENATVETNDDTGSETSDAESTSISFLDEVGEEFVIVDPAHRYGVESGSQEKETLLETTTEYLSDYLEEATSEEKDNFDKSHLEVENENDLILEVPNTDRNVSINESRKAKELTGSSKIGAIDKPISVTATKSSSNDQSVDEALNNSTGGTVPRYGHIKESTQDEQTTDNIANTVTVNNLAIENASVEINDDTGSETGDVESTISVVDEVDEDFVTVDPAHWYGVEYSSEEKDALPETTPIYLPDYVEEATSEESQRDNFDKSHLEVENENHMILEVTNTDRNVSVNEPRKAKEFTDGSETEKINKLISVTATKNSSNDQSSDEALKNFADGKVPIYDHIKESIQDEQTTVNITNKVIVNNLAIENATEETNNDTGSETSEAESISISVVDEVDEDFVTVDLAHRYGVESSSQEKETLPETTTEYLTDYVKGAEQNISVGEISELIDSQLSSDGNFSGQTSYTTPAEGTAESTDEELNETKEGTISLASKEENVAGLSIKINQSLLSRQSSKEIENTLIESLSLLTDIKNKLNKVDMVSNSVRAKDIFTEQLKLSFLTLKTQIGLVNDKIEAVNGTKMKDEPNETFKLYRETIEKIEIVLNNSISLLSNVTNKQEEVNTFLGNVKAIDSFSDQLKSLLNTLYTQISSVRYQHKTLNETDTMQKTATSSEESQKDNFDKSQLGVEHENDMILEVTNTGRNESVDELRKAKEPTENSKTENINKLISVTATKNSSNDQSSGEALKNSAGDTVPRYDHIKESTRDEQTVDNITNTVNNLAIENATVETNNDTESETSDAESTSFSVLDEVDDEKVQEWGEAPDSIDLRLLQKIENEERQEREDEKFQKVTGVSNIERKILGNEANFSVEIKMKHGTIHIPSNVQISEDPKHLELNFTWPASENTFNYSLSLLLNESAGSYLINKIHLDVLKAPSALNDSNELEGDDSLADWGEDVQVMFSNTDFLRIPKQENGAENPADQQETSRKYQDHASKIEIAIGSICAVGIILIVVYCLLSRRRKLRETKVQDSGLSK